MCRIPSAPPMPLIGTAYTVPKNRSDTEHFLATVVRQYDIHNRGMIVGWIGYLPNISLLDAELIKEVMSTLITVHARWAARLGEAGARAGARKARKEWDTTPKGTCTRSTLRRSCMTGTAGPSNACMTGTVH